MIKFLEVLLFALPSLAVERSDIPDKYKWDTTQLYATDAAWAKKRDEIAGRIPKLGAYQGHLGESAVKFYEALSSLLQVDEDLSQLSTYANMRTDEDTRAGAAREMKQSAEDLTAKFASATSFYRPEIIALGAEKVKAFVDSFPAKVDEYEQLLTENQIWIDRNRGVGILEADVALGLGVTGPLLRAAGVPHDLRKQTPYAGYEKYDFDVATKTAGDCEARYLVRVKEMRESTKIVGQVIESLPEGPVMVEDRKIAWPAQLALGEGGLGNAPEYIRKIMGESMEALIHHFKLVTEGFKVPAGEVYVPLESPRGELGYHIVSTGGTKPWRVHGRDPSFVNLQAMPHMVRGGLIADVIASVASIDPVMGGVDR